MGVAQTADDSLEPVLARLAASFAAAGYQLYLVGGAVRDRLLGRSSPDLDLTTDALPAEVRRLARDVQPDADAWRGREVRDDWAGLCGPEHRDHDLPWRAI